MAISMDLLKSVYSSSSELLTGKYFLTWITEVWFDLKKMIMYMYNSLIHCITFFRNVCGDHLLCGGFLCWLRSTDFSKVGPSERCVLRISETWVLLILPDKVIELRNMRRISFCVTNWKTTFPETGGFSHLRTAEFWRTKWKAMTFLKTGRHGFEYQKKIDPEQLSCLVLPMVKFFAYLKGCQFFNFSVQKVVTSSCIM